MKRALLALALAASSAPALAGSSRFDGVRVSLDLGFESSRFDRAASGAELQDSAMGVRLGGAAEYGRTFGRLYFGGAADYAWSDARNEASRAGVSTVSGFDHAFALTGKLGYLLLPNVMAYGLGGWEIGRLSMAATGAATPVEWHNGLRVGLGADYFLTGSVFARAEFDYTHYGRFDFASSGTSVAPDRAQALLGLGYRF